MAIGSSTFGTPASNLVFLFSFTINSLSTISHLKLSTRSSAEDSGPFHLSSVFPPFGSKACRN